MSVPDELDAFFDPNTEQNRFQDEASMSIELQKPNKNGSPLLKNPAPRFKTINSKEVESLDSSGVGIFEQK